MPTPHEIRFLREVGASLAAMARGAAPAIFWLGIAWGWLALATGITALLQTDWQIAATQITVALALLLGLPFGRAYRRRKAYHAELARRAAQL